MKEPMRITFSSASIIKVILWVAVFVGLFYLRDLVIALLVAVVVASAVEMPVKVLMKWRFSRGLAVTAIFLLFLAILASIAFIFLPPLADDIAQFLKTLPQILNSIKIFGSDMGIKDLSVWVQDLSKNIDKGQVLTVLKNTFFGTSGVLATSAALFGSLLNLLLTFFLAFYLALEERGVQKFLRLIVPKARESYVEDLWNRAQRKIGLWMQGQILLSFFVSLLVYVPTLILGVPYAALLAILAFVGELIPMVGLMVATPPALFLAWTAGGITMVAVVALVYFIIAQLESHVLYPRVMNKMVGVPSVIVIIALVAGAQLAGFWGVVLSVPVASVLMELANDLDKRKHAEIG